MFAFFSYKKGSKSLPGWFVFTSYWLHRTSAILEGKCWLFSSMTVSEQSSPFLCILLFWYIYIFSLILYSSFYSSLLLLYFALLYVLYFSFPVIKYLVVFLTFSVVSALHSTYRVRTTNPARNKKISVVEKQKLTNVNCKLLTFKLLMLDWDHLS